MVGLAPDDLKHYAQPDPPQGGTPSRRRREAESTGSDGELAQGAETEREEEVIPPSPTAELWPVPATMVGDQ